MMRIVRINKYTGKSWHSDHAEELREEIKLRIHPHHEYIFSIQLDPKNRCWVITTTEARIIRILLTPREYEEALVYQTYQLL